MDVIAAGLAATLTNLCDHCQHCDHDPGDQCR
jgi:hypothetical protein